MSESRESQELEIFTLDQLDRIQKPALEKVLEDRHRFDKVYKLVEEYAKKKSVIIGQNISIKILVKEPLDPDDFQYILYSENALHDSFALSNSLVQVTDAISMQTNIRGQEFTIQIQGRSLVQIINLKPNMRQIIVPAKIGENLYIPADYHLLDIYRRLYLPITDTWEDAFKYEKRLYNILKREFGENPHKFIGGKKRDPDIDIDKLRSELKNQIIKYFSGRKDLVLIGTTAYEILTEGVVSSSLQVQQIIDKNMTVDIIADSTLAPEMVEWIKHRTKLATTLKTSSVMLLSDFRLSRTTIYIHYQSSKIPVLFIYHSSEYDMVPFNRPNAGIFKGGQLGNPFVLLRFILVDIWLVKVIRAFGGIDADFAYNKISDLYQFLFAIRDYLKILPEYVQDANEHHLWSVFQPADRNGSRYIGKYYSEIHAKKDAFKEQEKIWDYQPVQFYKQHGKYKEI